MSKCEYKEPTNRIVIDRLKGETDSITYAHPHGIFVTCFNDNYVEVDTCRELAVEGVYNASYESESNGLWFYRGEKNGEVGRWYATVVKNLEKLRKLRGLHGFRAIPSKHNEKIYWFGFHDSWYDSHIIYSFVLTIIRHSLLNKQLIATIFAKLEKEKPTFKDAPYNELFDVGCEFGIEWWLSGAKFPAQLTDEEDDEDSEDDDW